MKTPKINPHAVKPSHRRFDDPKAPGGKYYLPCFQTGGELFFSRSAYKTASGASDHAVRVVERWKRLYDAWVAAESKKAVMLEGMR